MAAGGLLYFVFFFFAINTESSAGEIKQVITCLVNLPPDCTRNRGEEAVKGRHDGLGLVEMSVGVSSDWADG